MKRRKKGDGSLRLRKNGDWEGRYVDSLGKRKSVYGKTKKEVKNKLDKLTYTKSITKMNTLGGDVTMDAWFEHYVEAKELFIKEQSVDQIKLAYNFGSAYVSTRFRVLKREIESVYNMDLTGITPHCFRHTFATAGIASGVDIVTMKDLLGHANSKMLIDTYAHANLGIKKDSVNKITESYGIIDT